MPVKKKKKWKPQKPPKPPKPPKVEKPTRMMAADLRDIYNKMITANEGQIVDAMVAGLHWYQHNMPYLHYKIGTLNTVQAELYSSALTAALAARHSDTNELKRLHYTKCLQAFQKLSQTANIKVPKVESFLAVSVKKAETLNEEEKRLMAKYATVLVTLQRALKPIDYQMRPVALKIGKIAEPVFLDTEASTITFRRDQARALHLLMRKEGLYSAAIEASEPMARLQATVMVRDINGNFTGKRVIDPELKNVAVYRLLENLRQYALSPEGPKRFAKRPVEQKVGSTDGGQKRRGGFGKREKETTLGRFSATSAIGKVVTELGDGKLHNIDSLAKIAHPADVIGILKGLQRLGKEGGWQVEITDTQARLVKS